VTNSFGNRNFMQPMGRLSMHSKCLDFFSFSFVPKMFPSSSQWVPKMFVRFPMCSLRVFPIAPHFNPICFAQSPPLLTYRWAKGKGRWRITSFHRIFYFGEPQLFFWGRWLIATKTKKSSTCETPQLQLLI
jgi:hypothetical protein